jgi:hypothetical protein
MPFKSKAQIKKFQELEKEGKIKKGVSKAWKNETKNIKSLPERVHPKQPVKSIQEIKDRANGKRKA